jgi:hypothetical protein
VIVRGPIYWICLILINNYLHCQIQICVSCLFGEARASITGVQEPLTSKGTTYCQFNSYGVWILPQHDFFAVFSCLHNSSLRLCKFPLIILFIYLTSLLSSTFFSRMSGPLFTKRFALLQLISFLCLLSTLPNIPTGSNHCRHIVAGLKKSWHSPASRKQMKT